MESGQTLDGTDQHVSDLIADQVPQSETDPFALDGEEPEAPADVVDEPERELIPDEVGTECVQLIDSQLVQYQQDVERLTAENMALQIRVAELQAQYQPGHTDLMIAPEQIDDFAAENPVVKPGHRHDAYTPPRQRPRLTPRVDHTKPR